MVSNHDALARYAQLVLHYTREEAARLNDPRISPDHLAFGLARARDTPADAGSTSDIYDGQLIVVLLGAPHNYICAPTFCHRLEDLVRKRIACTREAHRIGGNQRQIEALRRRDQTAIDKLLTRLTVVRKLNEDVRVQLVEPSCKCHRLNRIGRIRGLFDESREHADERPARQADQRTSAVLLEACRSTLGPRKSAFARYALFDSATIMWNVKLLLSVELGDQVVSAGAMSLDGFAKESEGGVGVDAFRRLEVGMTENVLHVAEVRAAFE